MTFVLCQACFLATQAQISILEQTPSKVVELRNITEMYAFQEDDYFLKIIITQDALIETSSSGTNLETSYAEYSIYFVLAEYDEYPEVSIFSINKLYGLEFISFNDHTLLIKHLDLDNSKYAFFNVYVSHLGNDHFRLSIKGME
jgi:hypothetical protein